MVTVCAQSSLLLCSSLVSEWRSFSSLIHTTCWGPCFFMNHGWDHMTFHSQIFRSLWLPVNSWPAFKITPARPSVNFPLFSLFFSSGLHLPLQPASTGSPQHANLQVVNFQRYECASGSSKEPEPMPSTSGMSEIAVCCPSSVAESPSALPSPACPPSSRRSLLACSLDTSPCMPAVALYCHTFQGTGL